MGIVPEPIDITEYHVAKIIMDSTLKLIVEDGRLKLEVVNEK